jgi:hypothetical protein
MGQEFDKQRIFDALPGVTIREISLDERTTGDRYFIPNVKDFGVASTLAEVEEALTASGIKIDDILESFLRDVAKTRQQLLAEAPDFGEICVGLAVINRFLNGAVRGGLLPPILEGKVPTWTKDIRESYRMVFLSFEASPEEWIKFFNSRFGPDRHVRNIAEFSDAI